MIENKTNEGFCCQDSQDLQTLLYTIKERIEDSTTKNEKVKLLTLVPESWTIDKASDFFNVSKNLVKKSKKLKVQQGILCEPKQKIGKTISQDLKTKVINFYQDSEFSRICPGKKEFIAIKIDGKKVHKQKQLLLLNLKELYEEFKKRCENKISFSMFCSLRPKWCVTASSASGIHSVCICQIHQNAKLMSLSLPESIGYKTLL